MNWKDRFQKDWQENWIEYTILTLLVILCSFFLWIMSKADTLYFEPDKITNEIHKIEIDRQQNAYVRAKHGGHYEEAHKLALYNFQQAWLDLNHANIFLHKRTLTQETIEQAIKYLKMAESECKHKTGYDPGGFHREQCRLILEHVEFDLRFCFGRLENMEVVK